MALNIVHAILFLFACDICFCDFQNSSYYQFNIDSEFAESSFHVNDRVDVIRAFLELFKDIPVSTAVVEHGVSEKCVLDTKKVVEQANRFEIWALKLLDSTAKAPSGILNGNVNQYGDFDQCLSVNSQEGIKGKYCLSNIEVKINRNKFEEIDELVHSYRNVRSDLSDPGYRIPKISSNNWGICLPSSCSSADLQSSLNFILNNRTETSKISFEVRVDPGLCYVDGEKIFSFGNYVAVLFFLGVALLTASGTYLEDKIIQETQLSKIARCFSLKKNIRSLLDTSNEEIPVIHVARFFNAIALLLSHKQMALLFNPVINRTYMMEELSKPWSAIGRTAILYTDTFVAISGFLAAFSLMKELDRKKTINLKERYLARLIRFTPNLLAIILFCTYIVDHLGSGPQWGLVVERYSQFCKKNMWRNFLYIHNLFGFEEMCLTHTHQVGLDMQLYLVTPFIVYLMWKMPKIGIPSVILLAGWSTWLRYTVTIDNQLSTMVYFGITVSQLFRTARLSYILPTHRATVYLFGVMMGYLMRRGARNLKLKPAAVRIGWVVCSSCGLLAWFGPCHMGVKGYVYNVYEAAIFTAFSPIAWCIFLTWSIFACENGYGGWLGKLGNNRFFSVFSKLSYSVYLVQFPVFFYNVGRERGPYVMMGPHTVFDLPEFAVVFILSTLLCLLFELPCQGLRRLHKQNNEKVKIEEPATEDVIEDAEIIKQQLELSNSVRQLLHG